MDGLNKLLARIDGHAMIAHVAESALASFLWPVIVVGHFARGLGTSIRAGLACSSSPNCRHFPATMADVRFFLERHAGHVCEVAYPDDAVLADVDTREALGRLVSRS
jgi:CTP:molybdopterin cytidylyltransferase MocA